jgi:mannobiose 2-epimerase
LTLDSWLHLLEGCTVLAEVSRRPAVHAALGSLVELIGERLARHPCGTCPDDFGPGWRALPPTHHTVSYGHELERISLVLRAVDALGEDPDPFLERFTHLEAHLAEAAVDRRRGGVFYRGAPCRLAWHRQKFWWVQAEALYACDALQRRRQSALTAQLLDGTLRWVERYQHDPVTGDWHAAVLGTVPHDTPIAGPWKTPYHVGRALLALTGTLR